MNNEVLLSPIRLADIERLIEQSVKRAIQNIQPVQKKIPDEGNIDFAVKVIQTMSKSKIYKLTSENAIPHRKRGGKTLWFNREELENWLTNGMPHYGKQQAKNHLAIKLKK